MCGLSRAIKNLDHALRGLEVCLKLIENDENPIIETLASDIKQHLIETEEAINNFAEERDINIVDDLLIERKLFRKCDDLLSRCGQIMPKYSMYMSNKISYANKQYRQVLLELGEKVNSVLNDMADAYQSVSCTLSEKRTLSSNFRFLLKENYRIYCALYYNRDYKQLKRDAMAYKPYPGARLSEEMWGMLLKELFSAMDLAVKQQLVDTASDEYSSYYKDHLQENYSMVNWLSYALDDDNLFDFFEESDKHIKLYEELNVENKDLFFWLILRHDIIVGEMNNEQKKEFDEWRDVISYKKVESQEPSVLFTPEAKKLWKKLQDAGYVDEKYKPKVSQKKITVVALAMGETLKLDPLWQPFEELWDIKKASSQCSQARNETQYGPKLYEKVKALLRS